MSDAPRLKTTNFAAVDGAPIDRVARRVTGEGEHWKPLREITSPFSPNAIPVFPSKSDGMVGEKFDRLTVVGWSGQPRANDGKVWVVRCDCGNYCLRGSRYLRSFRPDRSPGPLTCPQCHYVELLKKGHLDEKCPPERHDLRRKWRKGKARV